MRIDILAEVDYNAIGYYLEVTSVRRFISVIITALYLTLLLCGCCVTCHYCGHVIDGDPVEADGNNYCDYGCYLDEVFE